MPDEASSPPLIQPAPRSLFARRSLWRVARVLLFLFFCLATLVALLYSVENWHGRRALNQFKAELQARGEPLLWQAIVPPAIPDDRNFAMTPLLKPLLDYERTSHGLEWRSSDDAAKAFTTMTKVKGPSRPGSESADLINLKAWQRAFRDADFPMSPEPRAPAADILLALSRFDAQFKELHEAAVSRPDSRWPVHYEENFASLVPHLNVAKYMVSALGLRASAHLDLQQPNDAFEDVKVGLRLADSINTDPILITHLVRLAMNSANVHAIREGLARHAWSEPQLAFFQEAFSRMNLLAEYKRCLRGERAFSIEAIEMSRTRKVDASLWMDQNGGGPVWAQNVGLRVVPSGWFYQNELNILKFHDQYTLGPVDDVAQRVQRPDLSAAEHELTNGFAPYKIFARILLPAVGSVLAKSARGQTLAQETVLACALERHYLAHKQYPEKVAELVPQYVRQIPRDVMDGQPLRYRRDQPADYILYSVGWNQTDDGGTLGMSKSKQVRVDFENGDWVWHLPRLMAKTEYE